ncbi:hypothetical protein FA13DRAFT_1726486 [Coprinellus micaceus]|uniref:Uncharacterized protein n=1 Tax=Coprinellus micaceus TaxID=71717 RepID=A0A4Y7TT99_COPMI|nr:hypothetical protein FA13DRAFT_1726486 [Coprinellus micaceus]
MSEALSSPSKSPAVQPWNQVGIDPSDIIGKVVKQVRKSCTHPTVTIDFDDDTSVQIRVDGYDPRHPGLPKSLETDSHLEELMMREFPIDIPVLGCAYVTLSDKAFDCRRRNGIDDTLQHWDQQHVGLALKFPYVNTGRARWHCIWATKQDHEEAGGACLFRSYEDVYLERLPRARRSRPNTPTTPTKHRRRKSRNVNL